MKERRASLWAGVKDWYAKSVLKFGVHFAAAFQLYRREKGCLAFNDQILLAAHLVANREVLELLRSRNLRVILDEAQDTTPIQFRILTELTLPAGSPYGEWPPPSADIRHSTFDIRHSTAPPGPRPGHFVMVGDAQQCIYASTGVDIDCYLRHGEVLEPAVFHVTFRCSRAVVGFVNARFPAILDGKGGQALFVELVTKRDADEGRLGRLILEAPGGGVSDGKVSKKENEFFRREVALLAGRLKELGPAGLGVERWSDVAILMPRNKWLSVLAAHLEEAGIPCRMTARRRNGDDAGWRWFTALLVALARGDDGYELAGVLREVFGISDSDMAGWVFLGGRLDLLSGPPSGAPPRMAETMEMLRTLKKHMENLPALAAVDEMVGVSALLDRLTALRKIPGLGAASSSSIRMVHLLRGRSSEAEARGISWKELAEELLAEKEADMPEVLPSEGRDGLVLMTCQKAKGQEWPVVILAGLNRPIRGSGNRRKNIEVLFNEDDSGGIACRVNGVCTRTWQEASGRHALKQDQEMRRVYYVACTRAKKHLILVDARGVWSSAQKSKLIKPIEALSAQAQDENDGWMDDINLWEAPLPAEKPAPVSEEAELPVVDWKAFASLPTTKVVHPSQMETDRRELTLEDREDRSPIERRVEPLHGALVYGNWWHDVMFRADWSSKDIRVFLKDATRELPEGALRERALSEIERFMGTSLFSELSSSRIQFHRELVYARLLPHESGGRQAWKPAKDAVEDGKIDFLYRKGENSWAILDWKTDMVTSREEAEAHARERYAGQLSAYIEALKSYGISVAGAALYFTAIGETMRVESGGGLF